METDDFDDSEFWEQFLISRFDDTEDRSEVITANKNVCTIPKQRDDFAIISAAINNQISTVRRLINKHGVSPTIIEMLIRHGQFEYAKEVIDTPTSRQLELAIEISNTEFAQWLVLKDQSIANSSHVKAAISRHNITLANWLMETCSDLISIGVIYAAVIHGYIHEAKIMIVLSRMLLTVHVYELASIRNDVEFVRWLIDGEYVNNSNVETCLLVLMLNDRYNFAQKIIELLNHQPSGEILDFAVSLNCTEFAKWLIEKKQVEITSEIANNAFSKRNLEFIQWLVDERGIELSDQMIKHMHGANLQPNTQFLDWLNQRFPRFDLALLFVE